ncbi:hypothetical protein K432DRAFT_387754 [Lepidopterella palustris CBS 459.81]|uniref:DUF7905 domain-containing protein n=1 Tax=Lepidopterella palustris CBS 459.81 TaxID=1314670 RepID=A0A8E2JLH6_9PEZI|nr:hypothetical protein K432DRAFT_387754 [Lepidopterella palustris CBS 459.81]
MGDQDWKMEATAPTKSSYNNSDRGGRGRRGRGGPRCRGDRCEGRGERGDHSGVALGPSRSQYANRGIDQVRSITQPNPHEQNVVGPQDPAAAASANAFHGYSTSRGPVVQCIPRGAYGATALGRSSSKLTERRLKPKEFAKIPAFIEKKANEEREKEQVKQKEAEHRGQAPLLAGVYAVVDWPEDCKLFGYPDPHKVLGRQLEKLDEIRGECEVWVKVEMKAPGKLVLEIRGENWNTEGVQQAQIRVGNVVKETTNKFVVPYPVHICLKQTGNVLLSAPPGTPADSWDVIPKLSVPAYHDHGMLDRATLAGIVDENQLIEMEEHLSTSLEAIRFWANGAFRMRIRLGTFVLERRDNIRKFEYSMEDFLKMMDNGIGMRQARVTKAIDDGAVESQLLQRLLADKTILGHLESTVPGNLDKVKPSYRATFLIVDPTSTRDKERALLLHMEWAENWDGILEPAPPKWSEIKVGKLQPKLEPRQHLDLDIVDLVLSRAWHFELESSEHIWNHEAPAMLTSFAKAIKINEAAARDYNLTSQFVTYPAGGKFTPMEVKHLKLERVWQFSITPTNYFVEAKHVIQPEPRSSWVCEVRHMEWDNLLRDLVTLTLGDEVKWGVPVKHFFPDNGKYHEENDRVDSTAGLRLLVERLMAVGVIVGGGCVGDI